MVNVTYSHVPYERGIPDTNRPGDKRTSNMSESCLT